MYREVKLGDIALRSLEHKYKNTLALSVAYPTRVDIQG